MKKAINLDGDAAVVGGIHSDSHDVTNNVNTYNTTNTTTHNTTNTEYHNIYQAQKSASELQQSNEEAFLQAVCQRLSDGILTDMEMAELNRLRMQLQISSAKAMRIIEEVKRGARVLNTGHANDYLSTQILEEVYNALAANNAAVLQRKLASLEQLAAVSTDEDVQFYYHLLLCSLMPEKSVVLLMQTATDNYWQLLWGYVAHIRLGQQQASEALLPRLGAFGRPQGDIALLMAIGSLWEQRHGSGDDYYLTLTSQYLAKAAESGMSETLYALWYTTDELSRDEHPEGEFKAFFAAHTLRELAPPAPEQKMKSSFCAPPPMPEFNARQVNLSQMQGFNALQAAQSMGLGVNARMPQAPPMPQSMPQAPKMPGCPAPGTHKAQVADVFDEHYGIILTDTNLLAQKYQTSRQEIIAAFQPFCEQAESQNMHWGFLDVADHYASLGQGGWTEYNALVTQFIEAYGLPSGPDLHLMIVGGEDVIPVPEVNDPYRDGNKIPTDTCYSFEGTYLPDLVDGGNFTLELSHARNNTARLPLEDGVIPSDVQSDLGAYFNLSTMYGGGIPVDSVVMSSNDEWIPASATMSQHLPLLCARSDDSLVKDRMYISPRLLTNDAQAMEQYVASIAHAGMLMFNLHGSDSPSMAGFYSSGEAFNPQLLGQTSARVFNTVACFGARYKGGYTRQQSMLLSALYGGGILLYTGSLIPVPMYSSYDNDEVRELMLHPGTGSEVFMRLYPLYQFKGMTAGKALLKAKCDYFNMMRHVEHDGFSLSTALMFCLYGNPMLHVKERADVVAAARGNTSIPAGEVKSIPMPVRKTIRQRVMQKNGDKNLLEQARGYVDGNLNAIRSITVQYVYQALGLPPACLDSIDACSTPNGDGTFDTGYSFNYHDPNAAFSPEKMVVTDSNGKIKRVYSTKQASV